MKKFFPEAAPNPTAVTAWSWFGLQLLTFKIPPLYPLNLLSEALTPTQVGPVEMEAFMAEMLLLVM